MAEEVLHVQRRENRGTRHARRLRHGGAIPAVLYGHGEGTVSLAVPAEEMEAAVRHGARLVHLEGAVQQQAFIRELQWDTWGKEILHADFTRVSAHEKVEVEVPIELRGEAPGLKEGGIVEQLLHKATLECEATDIPEKLVVNVNELNLGDSVSVSQLDLPKTATALDDADMTVVHCVEPVAVPEEAEEEAAAEAEPEVIGREGGEEEED